MVLGEMKFQNRALELPYLQILAGSRSADDEAAETVPSTRQDFLFEPGGQDYVGINSYDGTSRSE
jgi:hypothetical protein